MISSQCAINLDVTSSILRILNTDKSWNGARQSKSHHLWTVWRLADRIRNKQRLSVNADFELSQARRNRCKVQSRNGADDYNFKRNRNRCDRWVGDQPASAGKVGLSVRVFPEMLAIAGDGDSTKLRAPQ